MLRQLQPQLAARAAQAGGLAFALTALATLLAQVLVRDLAFGWSTTLQTSAPAYQQLMDALAWPWRAWLPAAVPGPDLVAQSVISAWKAAPRRTRRYWAAGGRSSPCCGCAMWCCRAWRCWRSAAGT
ncbi:DUF2868 domain-containing protein [Alcanivorax sp. IO_7]|nr:DUF2868 domain-containing protein [Alcanivorax sp. IO_7]